MPGSAGLGSRERAANEVSACFPSEWDMSGGPTTQMSKHMYVKCQTQVSGVWIWCPEQAATLFLSLSPL